MVAETDHSVILDKPALLDSQNSKPGRPSVVDWLQERYGFSGLVHRLDFGTSGLMVCAKTKAAAEALTKAMQDGRIGRTYWAIVFRGGDRQTLPDEGRFTEALDEKSAETRYRVLERFANAALVEVDLETGRKHQIRRHFSQAGHPLLGDHLYGRGGSDRLFDRPALHARKLEVEGKTYEASPPEDFEGLLTRLRKSKPT